MKKVKVVNGYVITAHTEKEQREYDLGPYGIIAEIYYTGYMPIDIAFIDFKNYYSLEEAIEQALNLDGSKKYY